MLKKAFSTIFVVIILLIQPVTIFAADNTFRIGPPQDKGYGVYIPNASADTLLETVIQNALMLIFTIGAIAVVIFVVWGALDWIMAGGDKDKLAAARKKITQSLIGLVLLALSAVIITVIGEIVGFNPLKELQIPGLGDQNTASSTTKKP